MLGGTHIQLNTAKLQVQSQWKWKEGLNVSQFRPVGLLLGKELDLGKGGVLRKWIMRTVSCWLWRVFCRESLNTQSCHETMERKLFQTQSRRLVYEVGVTTVPSLPRCPLVASCSKCINSDSDLKVNWNIWVSNLIWSVFFSLQSQVTSVFYY